MRVERRTSAAMASISCPCRRISTMRRWTAPSGASTPRSSSTRAAASAGVGSRLRATASISSGRGMLALDAAAVGAMTAGAAIHLAERDADQQPPQVAALAEQDFAVAGEQEEAAVGRLDHVLGVHAGRQRADSRLRASAVSRPA